MEIEVAFAGAVTTVGAPHVALFVMLGGLAMIKPFVVRPPLDVPLSVKKSVRAAPVIADELELKTLIVIFVTCPGFTRFGEKPLLTFTDCASAFENAKMASAATPSNICLNPFEFKSLNFISFLLETCAAFFSYLPRPRN